MGTFLPATIGLAVTAGLDFGTTLIFTGLYNIASGLLFRCPMCVQPMHTISGVALASAGTRDALGIPQIASAGLFVSGCVLVLGTTRLAELAAWLVPPPIVRGVQLGVGLQVAAKGIDMALRTEADGRKVWRGWLGTDGLVLGASALALLLVTTIAPHLPCADAEWPPLPRGTPLDALLLRQQQQQLKDAGEGGGGSDGEEGVVGGAEAVSGGSGGVDAGGVERCAQEQAQLHRRGGSGSGGDGAGGAAVPRVGAPGAGHTRAAPDACLDWDADACIGARVAGVPAVATDVCTGGARASSSGDALTFRYGGAVPAATAGSLPSGCRGGGGCSSDGGALPSALVLVLLGLLFSAAADPSALSALRLGPSVPRVVLPSWRDFGEGVVRAGLPQLPLTMLNSVIAVTSLARQLFPDRAESEFAPSRVAASVGAMNLVGCWLGAVPCCHGSGGLAAQVKFGARSGAAPLLLGCAKLLLGLLLGSSLLQLLAGFPAPLLGSLLALSGVELGCAARVETGGVRGFTLLLLTAAAIVALGTGPGFLLGWVAAALLAATAWAAPRVATMLGAAVRRDGYTRVEPAQGVLAGGGGGTAGGAV